MEGGEAVILVGLNPQTQVRREHFFSSKLVAACLPHQRAHAFQVRVHWVPLKLFSRSPSNILSKFFFSLLVLFGRAGYDFASTYGHFYLFSWTLSQVAELESWCFKSITEWAYGDWWWCLSTWRQTLDTLRQALSRKAGCSCKVISLQWKGLGECEMT